MARVDTAQRRRGRGGQGAVPADHGRPQEAEGGLDAYVRRAMAEVVPVTYWFTPGPRPRVQSVTIRFTGQRQGVTGKPGPKDHFVHHETVHGVVAGSGPVAVTAKVAGVNPGEWQVTAKMVPPPRGRQGRPPRSPAPTQPVHPAAWSWLRWRLREAPDRVVLSRPAPLVGGPAVLVGGWPVLTFLGILVGLVTQSVLAAREDLGLGVVLPVSLAAVVAGAVGAKLWYLALHRRDGQGGGWCIQGLVLGIAVVAPLLLAFTGTPIGTFFDVSAPGMLFGMAIGRLGCFFAGCCCGRPTASRWAVWSSNRRLVGVRRLPAQLLESAWTAAVGAGTLAGVLAAGPAHGAWFVGGLAAYTLGRQAALQLREEQKSRRAAVATALVAAAVLVADTVLVVGGVL